MYTREGAFLVVLPAENCLFTYTSSTLTRQMVRFSSSHNLASFACCLSRASHASTAKPRAFTPERRVASCEKRGFDGCNYLGQRGDRLAIMVRVGTMGSHPSLFCAEVVVFPLLTRVVRLVVTINTAKHGYLYSIYGTVQFDRI